MLGNEEQHEIRQFIYSELARIEHQVSHDAGSYEYLCLLAGCPTFCHRPVGPVLRTVTRLPG